MKNIKIKYILIILILFAGFKLMYSAEIEKYLVDSMKDVDVYMLKGVNTTKQLTIKGTILDLNIIGVEEAKFEIFTSKDGTDLEKFNNTTSSKMNIKLESSSNLKDNDSELVKELREMLKELKMKETKFKAVKSIDALHKSTKVKNDEFEDISILKTENELIINLEKVRNSVILVPENISLVIGVDKGEVNIQSINGEIVINGQQLETNITNVSAVINYMNKSGDISISDYEGVANMKSLHGDISVVNSSGKLKFQSSAGDININKFIGDIDIDIQVGDIQILNSEDMSINLANKSGDVLLKNIKGKTIEISSASSDIAIFDLIAKNIEINNLSGDILLNAIKSDLDLNINSGDLMLKNFEPLFEKDSKIGVNFGDVNIALKDPNLFKYFQSVNENELKFDKSIKLNKDLKICTKDKKCIIISLNYGQISVEKIK